MTFTDPRFAAEPLFNLQPFEPNGLAFAPDGRLFVWQRSGQVWIYKNGILLPDPFVDLRSEINPTLDDGLLGLTFDPNFTINGQVYLLYTHISGGSRLTRVTASPVNPDVAVPGSEVVIFGDIPKGFAHVIGTVRTGLDGNLFVGVGDLSDFNFTSRDSLRAQDLNSPAGKILRMDVDGNALPDNPFYDGTNSIRSRVWAYGLRNPFRFGLHPVSGEPYIGDVGWNEWEEINRGRGSNFGWPCYEGNGPQPQFQDTFVECQQVPSSAVTPPLYTYRHTGLGGAVVGGTFYTATQYPAEFRNNFFFGDYVFGTISRMIFDDSENLVGVEPFAGGVQGPVAIEMGPDGFLYYLAINTGEVGRIRFAGATARASAAPSAGYSPLTVSFSSTGSIDPNGFPLAYFWNFGDGATSTEPNPTHTYAVAGVAAFTARLTVTDILGVNSSATVRVTLGSLPPTAAISSPIDGTPVFVGDVIAYQGSAVDPDQGVLPPAALGWQVLLHHNDHVHPFGVTTGLGGSFTVIDHDTNGVFAYEVVLNATDASGLIGRKSVLLPFNPQKLPYVTAVVFSPTKVVGGGDVTGTVTLSVPAPSGGVTITLASNHPTVQLPTSVVIPGGNTSATFSANTSAVAAAEISTISAALNGIVRTTLTVTPPPSAASLSFSPNLVRGGTGTTGTVRLTGPASNGGMTVSLTSNTSAVQVPAFVIIPGGIDSATFPVTTSSVSTEVAATITAKLNGTVLGALTINPVAGGAIMNYPDRTALLADGWTFLARTAGGATRNTEQTSGLVVSYDQTLHPGVIRIPTDEGEIWGASNDTRNTLFRDLPANWTGIQLGISAFAPTANWQNVCLLAYQDDDNYVTVCRNFVDGQIFESWLETSGAPSVLVKSPNNATANILLRIDRNPATEILDISFSTNNGATWTGLGSTGKVLANPRLGIFIGANGSQTAFPAADLAFVRILTGTPLPPALSIAPTTLAFSAVVGGADPVSKSLSITNSGGGALSWTASVDQPWVSLDPPDGSAPGSLGVSVATAGLGSGIHNAVITLTSTEATNSPRTIPVSLSLSSSSPSGPSRIDFNYPDRAALLAGGWDFLARNAGGAARNTEQTSGRVVSYDQILHPGVIRIPTDLGDLWGGDNNTRNTLFRDLPANWTSIRMKIASFAPTANWQAACLAAYQNDENYVVACRNFVNGQLFQSWYETGGNPVTLVKTPGTATTDILLRLDRNPANEAIGAFFSADGGVTWTALGGSVVKPLNNPRLGIFTGANGSTTVFPAVDISYVEIQTPVSQAPVLAVNPAVLSFSGIAGGQSPSSQTLNITNEGGGTLTWTVSADQPWITVSPNGGGAPGVVAVGVIPDGLAAGVYHGSITITSPGAANSPRTVSVSLLLASPPVLTLSPTSFSFNGVAGGQAPPLQTLNVTNTGGGTISWSASADQSWVTLNPASGIGAASISIGALSSGLSSGTRTATITMTAAGAVHSPQTINVTLVLTPTPVLALAPTSLAFTAIAGGSNPLPQTITITNTGSGTLTWTSSSDQPWLTVSPGSGTAPGSTTASIAIAGLTPGTYNGTVTFASVEAANSPRSIPVTLSLAPPPSLSVVPSSIGFTVTQGGAAPPSQTLSVSNFGAGTLTWTASADQPWVTITPVSGSAPGVVTVSVLPTGLAAGTYNATLTFTSPQASNSPRTTLVSLTVSPSALRINFTYPDRAALLAGGWNFLARTASGTTRNTEQTSGRIVDFNQSVHPGLLRIPADLGDLWDGENNTRNTLFRNLPANWTSIRMKIGAFTPSANWQNACLVAYENDDRYVVACRNFVNGQLFEGWHESAGNPAVLAKVAGSATSNILLRIDRNPATEAITPSFSINDGATWTTLGGSVVKALTNPRLGVFIGANGSTTVFPTADIEYVEILVTQ
jgi:glucose/arabinose dehydrogenase